MTYYLIWWLGGWAFSVWAARLVDDVTLGEVAGLFFLCVVFGVFPGMVYLQIAANPDKPIVVWRKR